jgi:hypothetical protein
MQGAVYDRRRRPAPDVPADDFAGDTRTVHPRHRGTETYVQPKWPLRELRRLSLEDALRLCVLLIDP